MRLLCKRETRTFSPLLHNEGLIVFDGMLVII
jgi:hypothetical protein